MRFLPFFILLILGLAAGYLIAPFEQAAVRNYLIGFPNADQQLHNLRPWAVYGLCLVPALGGFWYAFASILDRYLFRKTLSTFLITISGFLLLYLLLDLQDSLSDISQAKNLATFLPTYYGVLLSQTIVLLLPFSILLALLHSLGQLSSSREIIAFTQTGRGIFRLLRPLVVLGCLLSLVSFFLNYHLAPWAQGYRDALLESTERGTTSQASNVIHHNASEKRLWFIGGFPYDLSGKSALVGVQISIRNEDGSLRERLKAPEVSWNRETGDWIFRNPTRLQVQSQPTPEYEEELPNPLVISGWTETPSQLIQEGLDARNLGIPGIQDWLHNNPDRETFLARAFETQFHYRWSQPWLCLVTVLLSAPLGISFSRRAKGGTVLLAITLSLLMLFCSEVFLAFGDSGQIPAVPAAWATNAIFFLLAQFLIQRRLKGRPIFQTFRKVCGD